ncbi:MAG: hypothetical protein WA960_02105 [Tunicatimonas sp.]
MIKENTTLMHQTPYLEVYHDHQINVVIYRWIGRVKDQDSKSGLHTIVDIIKKKKAKSTVADLTRFMGGPVETAKWMNEVGSKMLADAGVEKMALKLPESAFGEFSIKLALGSGFSSSITVEKFTDWTDIYRWLEQQHAPQQA